jgi:hypothetical protein
MKLLILILSITFNLFQGYYGMQQKPCFDSAEKFNDVAMPSPGGSEGE